MFKKIFIMLVLGLINISCFIAADQNNDRINRDKAYAKGSKEIAGNIIRAVRTNYSGNNLMNAIISRNVADVKMRLENIKNIDEQFNFSVKFSGFETVPYVVDSSSDQTYLSLALLNSAFDSTEEEKNKSLSIIDLLIKSKASNALLVHNYVSSLEDNDNIRFHMIHLSIFGWSICCGCDEKVLKLLLDSGFVNDKPGDFANYKEFAEHAGSSAVSNLLNEYIQKMPSRHSTESKKREDRSKRTSKKRSNKSSRSNCRGCSRKR